jgi:hypothetical protein
VESSTSVHTPAQRVVHPTRGHRHGPTTRLMRPSDLGERLKPFVFLDLFEADMGGSAVCPARSKHVSQCAEETSHVL